jgi:hypothetical protein
VKASNFKLQTSNSKGCLHKLGSWCLVFLWSLEFGVWSFAAGATNSPDLGPIPPLRPPRSEIPPSFWEQHGLWIVAGSLGFLALIGGLVWRLSRPRAARLMAPALLARQALEQLQQRPENGVVLSWVSQILRHYLNRAFGLPPEELTTAEFCDLIAKNEKIGPGLAADIDQFLRACDERKFAASLSENSLGASVQALKLIDRAEARLAEFVEVTAAPVPREITHKAPVK